MTLEKIQHISDLRNFIEHDLVCDLKKGAHKTVFADGDAATAKIMVIGEAPGADEDASGLPFVGRSGQLLRKLLAQAGFKAEELYITNMMFWRPPENRTPTKAELAITHAAVMKHIELLAPEVVVLVGNVPAQTLLGTKTGVTKLRGNWQELHVAGQKVAAMPVYHPAYLLRSRRKIVDMEADLKRVRTRVAG